MEIQFIEPCCASRQLPPLLQEQKVASFQTNGDVTFDHILKAVASLAGDALDIRLMVPTINVAMLRTLAWFGRRGWLKHLHVLTQDKQDALIRNETADSIPSVACYHHERVADSLLAIDGEKGSVVIAGRFLTSIEPGIRFYTAAIGNADSGNIRMFTATIAPLMRPSAQKPAAQQSAAEPAAPQPAAPQPSPQPTSSPRRQAFPVLGGSAAEPAAATMPPTAPATAAKKKHKT